MPVPAAATPAAPGEFALIERWFARATTERQGIGDDCALIDAGGTTLALTKDLLVEGVHFLPGTDPAALGHKALAVNLSDLAAAGASPRCFLLGLGLAEASSAWLDAFSSGLFALARAHACALVGGDTTRSLAAGGAHGPIVISITAIGSVDPATYAGRSGARPGDDLWISGTLGEAAAGLLVRQGRLELSDAARAACLRRLDWPEPRLALGRALAGLASAVIDVSDGLLGDLGHILRRSGVGAELDWAALPRPEGFAHVPEELQWRCVLAGGDDYELLFSAPRTARERVAALATAALPLARIGRILPGGGCVVRAPDGRPIGTTLGGYQHFAPRD